MPPILGSGARQLQNALVLGHLGHSTEDIMVSERGVSSENLLARAALGERRNNRVGFLAQPIRFHSRALL